LSSGSGTADAFDRTVFDRGVHVRATAHESAMLAFVEIVIPAVYSLWKEWQLARVAVPRPEVVPEAEAVAVPHRRG
jgi:hypothetical protein